MGEKLAGQVPEFITYLKSDDRETRQLGAVLLAAVGPKAKAAVPGLLEAAESRDSWVSLSVARALWSIDRQTNAAVRVYTSSLQSTNSTHRQLALVYLRQMGTAAKAAGPQIQAAQKDSDYLIRQEAEKTLREVDPDLLYSSFQEVNKRVASASMRGPKKPAGEPAARHLAAGRPYREVPSAGSTGIEGRQRLFIIPG